jgi:hypothetical protein
MDASPPKPHPRSHLAEITVVFTVLAVMFYLLGYQPVARRADSLDRPLRLAWESFASTNQSSEATAGVVLDQLPARLELIKQASLDLTSLRFLVEDRVRMHSNVLAQLDTPFQLIDFENERLRYAESLFALAKSKKVGFEPAATNGLPEYTADTREPALLWARLDFARHLLLAAVHAPVSSVRDLVQLPAVSHRSLIDGRRYYEELPMRVEVVGPVEGVGRFLVSLPLHGDELASLGLAAPLTNKPVLFISHVLARKSAPERPGEVRVELIASGFVPTEDSDRAVAEGGLPPGP